MLEECCLKVKLFPILVIRLECLQHMKTNFYNKMIKHNSKKKQKCYALASLDPRIKDFNKALWNLTKQL